MADSRQDNTPYVDALLEYSARETGRFQVPGHKGGLAADPAMVELVGMTGLINDVPSVTEGVDIGPEPTPFQKAQLLAAEAWGAQRTWFLINGASQGNHATSMALGHMGGEMVVQRNVHSSIIDGLVLNGMRPSFVSPELDPELGIAHGLTPESLAAALDATPNAVAALVVSPTYFGACADVAALAEVAHSRGLPLICDEAWGAHLHFHPDLPPDALASGADLVTSSTHKIVGSLTQAAMLHLGQGDRIDPAIVDRCVSLVETTSPSGLLTGSLDAARRMAAVHGEELLTRTLAAIARTREQILQIPGLGILDESMVGRAGIAGWDPLRLSIDVRGTGSTGYRLAKKLFYSHGIDLELYSENVVVGIFGMGEPPETGERLVAALRASVGELEAEPGAPQEKLAPPPPWGELVMTPREAYLGPQEVVRFEDAVGRIAAEGLAAYPPGIPNVLPGERLTAETLAYIRESIAHGGYVRGGSDRELKTLRVSAER
ncbi:MAG TPA: amino acid decarboxylase [Solirubrobacterales bacterium]